MKRFLVLVAVVVASVGTGGALLSRAAWAQSVASQMETQCASELAAVRQSHSHLPHTAMAESMVSLAASWDAQRAQGALRLYETRRATGDERARNMVLTQNAAGICLVRVRLAQVNAPRAPAPQGESGFQEYLRVCDSERVAYGGTIAGEDNWFRENFWTPTPPESFATAAALDIYASQTAVRDGGHRQTGPLLHICAARLRASQLRRAGSSARAQRPEASQTGSAQRPGLSETKADSPNRQRAETEQERLAREEREKRARLEAQARNIRVRQPVPRVGESTLCIQITDLGTVAEIPPAGADSAWLRTRYRITNTCARPLVVSFKSTESPPPDSYSGQMVGNMQRTAWRIQPGRGHVNFPQVGFEYYDPSASDTAYGVAGNSMIEREVIQTPHFAHDIRTSVAVCDYVKVIGGRNRLQTMLREHDQGDPHRRIACHPLIDVVPDPVVAQTLRIGQEPLRAPPGEDPRLTRCYNRDGATAPAQSRAACRILALDNSLAPGTRASISYEEATAFRRQRDYERAIEEHERGILTFATPQGYNGLGSTYFESGDYRRAVEAFDNALRLNPDDAMVIRNRAIALNFRDHPEMVAERQAAAAAEEQQRIWAAQTPGVMARLAQECSADRERVTAEEAARTEAGVARTLFMSPTERYIAQEQLPQDQNYARCLLTLRESMASVLPEGAPEPDHSDEGIGGDSNTALLTAVGLLLASLLAAVSASAVGLTRSGRREQEEREESAASWEASQFGLTLSLFMLPYAALLAWLQVATGSSDYESPLAIAAFGLGVPIAAFFGGWASYSLMAGQPRRIFFFNGVGLALLAGIAALVAVGATMGAAAFYLNNAGGSEDDARTLVMAAAIATPTAPIMTLLWLPIFLVFLRGALKSAALRRIVLVLAILTPLAATLAAGVYWQGAREVEREANPWISPPAPTLPAEAPAPPVARPAP